MPLRDALHPLGLPNVGPMNQQRIDAANTVYRHAVRLLFALFRIGAFVTLENPLRSWLWTVLATLVKQFARDKNCPEFLEWYFRFHPIEFDFCMHGGSRAKSTRLLASTQKFAPLGIMCDKSHSHEPWTIADGFDKWIFSTAAEAQYAMLFCERYAECASTLVTQHDLDYTSNFFRLQSLMAQSIQTKGHDQLIPEFALITVTTSLPKSPHKLLARLGRGGNDGEGSEERYKVGIYFNHQEHLQKALSLHHPAFTHKGVPDDLKRAVFFVATHSLAEVASHRINMLSECVGIAKRLTLAEKLAKIKMDKNVAEVTKAKRIELWEKLLTIVGFEDMEVVRYMREGVTLTGWEDESKLYKKRWNPPSMTTQQLDHSALWRRKALMGKPPTEDEIRNAKQLMDETTKEVDAGFLDGPFLEDEVTEMLGRPDWSMSQRFLLLQGEDLKPRVIDNYKTSWVNAAFGTSSHLDLHDTDMISCFLAFMLGVFCGDGAIDIELSGGDHLVGRRHSDYDDKPLLLGRGVDLSKAYKQAGVAPQSARHSILGVRSETGVWKFFFSKSLPFGATSSVFAFNKITRGIWTILVRKFHLLTTVFYDDFPMLEFDPMAATTTNVVQHLLDLLGWKHATNGKKSVDFSGTMQVLGVSFNLESFWDNQTTVANRPSRVQRILEMLASYSNKGTVSISEAATMHGLLNYAGGFVVGRCLKPAARQFGNMQGGSTDAAFISRLCRDTGEIINRMRPRQIRYLSNDFPAVIYTDGALEKEQGTWGAVVMIPQLGINAIHWGVVDAGLMRHWTSLGLQQKICQIELLAVLLVKYFYRRELANASALFFVDKEAARYCLIKGSSPSLTMYNLCRAVSHIEAEHPAASWYERVASESNIADLPSRFKLKECQQITRGSLAGDILLPPETIAEITNKENPNMSKTRG